MYGPLSAVNVGSYMTRDPQRTMQRWRRIATAVDVFALVAAALLAAVAAGRGQISAGNAWLAAVDVSFVLVVMSVRARRVRRLQASAIDGCVEALKVCSLGALLALATAAIVGADRPVPLGPELWLLTAVGVCAARAAMQLAQNRARRRGALMTPTLVVGPGLVGNRDVVRRLLASPEYGLRPVGFLDSDPAPGSVDVDVGVPVLGGPDDLVEVRADTGAGHVVLAFGYEQDHRLAELVKRCQELGVGVSLVPSLYESVSERGQLDHVGGLPLFSPHAIDPRGWQFTVKHAIDRVFALLALMVLSPVLLTLALAVRVSSPGPVIFRQRRVGRDGRVFELLKFRTMLVSDGEKFTPRADVAPGGIEGVDRRTPVGRWLRSSSLDELPQLVNVLRGEMSLIGPRPERPEFAEQFAREVPDYDDRLRVRSGINGMGPGKWATRADLDRRSCRVGQPLHQQLVARARAPHRRAHTRGGRTLSRGPARGGERVDLGDTAERSDATTRGEAHASARARDRRTGAPGQLVLRILRRGSGRWRSADPDDARL
jgi:exopolysaccharide biosynthesis polyprenyl glycosylphosphotransferase